MSVEISTTPLVRQSRSRFAILLSWLVILGLAGRIAYTNARAGESPTVQRLMNDERARMFGMLAVQTMSLQKDSAPASALVRQRLSTLIEQLEEDARTAEDRIRVAILTGEALGMDAALQKLSSISEGTANVDVRQDIQSVRTIYTAGSATGLSAPAQEGLIRRHGYLGRLALAHGVPADQEPRKTLQTEAFWFAVRLTAVGVGLMTVMAVSVAAFVLACVWLVRGRLKTAYATPTSYGGAFLEGFALYLVLFVALGVGLRYFGPVSLQWNWLALAILPIVWVWTALRGSTSEERRQAFGWTRGQGFLREVGAGLGGYLAGLVVIAVGCLLTLLLVRITGAQASSPIVQELGGGPWRVAGLYAMACIFAPVIEETMFRGVLFHHLRQRWSWIVTAAIVSVIFATLHPQGWVAVPALSAIAMVLAALREWRGSLIAPMAAHACNNFLVLTLALLFLR
jgi:membrane protease YdiL (CAAX protease family)